MSPNRRSFLLSLSVTGLFPLFVIWTLPLLYVSVQGNKTESLMLGSLFFLFEKGEVLIGISFFLTCFALPLLIQVFAIIDLLYQGRSGGFLARLANRVTKLKLWSMLDVFFLGLLISYIKLNNLVVLSVGEGGFALGIFMVLNLVFLANYKRLPGEPGEKSTADPKSDDAPPRPLRTKAGLLRVLNDLKPDMVNQNAQIVWALLISSSLILVLANILPIMITTTLGTESSYTIMGGILELLRFEMWFIGGVVLFASIFVPVLKLLILAYLLLADAFFNHHAVKLRLFLYRLVESVGKWSMVDVFVVVVLAGTVNFGELSRINAGAGTAYFCTAVILTMLASISYHPALNAHETQID